MVYVNVRHCYIIHILPVLLHSCNLISNSSSKVPLKNHNTVNELCKNLYWLTLNTKCNNGGYNYSPNKSPNTDEQFPIPTSVTSTLMLEPVAGNPHIKIRKGTY